MLACGPLEPHMSASGVVVAPVAGKPWRRWRVPTSPSRPSTWPAWSTAEDVARTASGELVDACTGERHHFSTIIDLAIKAHTTQSGAGTSAAAVPGPGRAGRCREGGLDILLGVDVGVRRCEAGTCLAVDLVAKAAVRTPGALSTVSDLIIALFGERGPRSPKEVEAQAAAAAQNVTILRKDFARGRRVRGDLAQELQGQGRLVATSTHDLRAQRRDHLHRHVPGAQGPPVTVPAPSSSTRASSTRKSPGEDGLRQRQPKRDADGKKIEKVIYIPAERLRPRGRHARGINMTTKSSSCSPCGLPRDTGRSSTTSRGAIASSPASRRSGSSSRRDRSPSSPRFSGAASLRTEPRTRLQLGGHKLGEWRQENQVFRVAARTPERPGPRHGRRPRVRRRPSGTTWTNSAARAGTSTSSSATRSTRRGGAARPGVGGGRRPDSSVGGVTHGCMEPASAAASPGGPRTGRHQEVPGVPERERLRQDQAVPAPGGRHDVVRHVESLKTAGSARYRDIVRAIAGQDRRQVRRREPGRRLRGRGVAAGRWTSTRRTGAAPTALVAVHVALAGAYDSTIPSMVTAACTVDKLVAAGSRRASRLDARLDEHLADVIGLAVCDV